MKFKEYLEEKEIDEGIANALSGVVDAGVSGIGTLGKQIVRGAGNTISGAAGVAAHGLSRVFGDKKSREDAKEKLSSSMARTGRGIAQIATSPIASLARGWEAGRDPFSRMKTDSGSGWGEMMGLRRKKKSGGGAVKSAANKEKTSTNVDKDIYFLSIAIPDDVEMYVDKIYKAIKQGKRVVLLGMTPKDYLSKLMTKYSGVHKNRNTTAKLRFIVTELFSYYKFNKLILLGDQNIELDANNIQKISEHINKLFDYINNQELDIILVPEDKKLFAKEMLTIHNFVLDKSKFNKNLSGMVRSLRSKAKSIVDYYEIGKIIGSGGVIKQNKQIKPPEQEEKEHNIVGNWAGYLSSKDGTIDKEHNFEFKFLDDGSGEIVENDSVPTGFAWKTDDRFIKIIMFSDTNNGVEKTKFLAYFNKKGNMIIKVSDEEFEGYVVLKKTTEPASV